MNYKFASGPAQIAQTSQIARQSDHSRHRPDRRSGPPRWSAPISSIGAPSADGSRRASPKRGRAGQNTRGHRPQIIAKPLFRRRRHRDRRQGRAVLPLRQELRLEIAPRRCCAARSISSRRGSRRRASRFSFRLTGPCPGAAAGGRRRTLIRKDRRLERRTSVFLTPETIAISISGKSISRPRRRPVRALQGQGRVRQKRFARAIPFRHRTHRQGCAEDLKFVVNAGPSVRASTSTGDFGLRPGEQRFEGAAKFEGDGGPLWRASGRLTLDAGAPRSTSSSCASAKWDTNSAQRARLSSVSPGRPKAGATLASDSVDLDAWRAFSTDWARACRCRRRCH